MTKRKVIVDSREQKMGHLSFANKDYCEGAVVDTLKTGDYCLSGLQEKFTIERKRNTAEFSGNITKAAFERELSRMDLLDHSFLVLEFTISDVLNFPFGSGIPKSKWRRLRVSSSFILKRIIEIETTHKVKVIFAGENSQRVIDAIMRQMAKLYDKEPA